THKLALACRPFLRRFFAAWDGFPGHGILAEHITWLRRFADDLGLIAAAASETALTRLWDELEQWQRLEQRLHGPGRLLERSQFLQRLAILASEVGLARTQRGPGRVRVLSAPLVRGLAVPYLFVMGLGERSFPRLTPPESLLDEQERQS